VHWSQLIPPQPELQVQEQSEESTELWPGHAGQSHVQVEGVTCLLGSRQSNRPQTLQLSPTQGPTQEQSQRDESTVPLCAQVMLQFAEVVADVLPRAS